MDPKRFSTYSIRNSPHGDKITRILSAAIQAVNPYEAVVTRLLRHNGLLHIDHLSYELDGYQNIFVVAFGKASYPMILAAKNVLGAHFSRGIAITKSSSFRAENSDPAISLFQGSHPVPDEKSVNSTRKVIELLKTTEASDLVIFLISGGGSSLLTSPVDQVSLEDIQSITKLLLRCGANINEINCVRKHLSKVKGGGLARYAAPAQALTLILSDVIHDPLDVIASGPTVADTTRFSDAQQILEKYRLIPETPKNILLHIDQGINGAIPETPKIDDPIFERVDHLVIGNNYLAAKAAKGQAKLEGYNSIILTSMLQGEARQVGKFLASIAEQVAASSEPIQRPACIIAGGETTVTISGDGLGGRNQEVALAAVKTISPLNKIMLITLATDGDDGPTNAAGAVVTEKTNERAKILGNDPEEFLAVNDSYHFFEPLGDLLLPGQTDTNVCDLNFIFAFS